jgi:hypothetical protein
MAYFNKTAQKLRKNCSLATQWGAGGKSCCSCTSTMTNGYNDAQKASQSVVKMRVCGEDIHILGFVGGAAFRRSGDRQP